LLHAPHALRHQAENGRVLSDTPPGHADSWGIGWYDAAGKQHLAREVGSAADSTQFSQTAQSLGNAPVVIGHLRKASCGAVTVENAHPFAAPHFLLQHNGTMRPPLMDALRAEVDVETDNDTALLTAWLATQPSIEGGLRELLRRAKVVAPKDPPLAYSALNLLIATPRGLYALRQFTKTGEYYTLYQRTVPGGWVVASEPTDGEDVQWQLLTPGCLTFYPAGASGGEICETALQ
jgi:glutamine amidotransferase